ncbi:MAG: FtsX-like permease family protein [Cyclobacteriaceae bacterium]
MSSNPEISPPKIPLQILRWFCHPDLIEDVEGDLSEIFATRFSESKVKAKLLYMLDVLMLFRPGIIKNFETIIGQIKYAMLKNYFKIAIRNSIKYKGYTTLNLLGLVVGIASSMLIYLWVSDETGVDKFHKNGDKIYQVFRNMKQSNGMVSTTATIPKPAADLIAEEYPEVDEVAILSWPMEFKLAIGDENSAEIGRFCNPEFINMFSFELVAGDKSTALNEMLSIVISQDVAEKYFGDKWRNAIGKSFRVEDQYDVTITGVFKTIGENSSIDFDWLIPAQGFIAINDWVNDWGNGSFRIYITIPDANKVAAVGERLENEIMAHTADNNKAGDELLLLHKFKDTYLYSNFDNGVISGGRIDYVNIMTVVAIFILIVACINFMNLTTARANRRSKEIGVRKVMGANKGSVSTQFFFEAILFTSISVALSALVVVLILPYFNVLVNKALIIDFAASHTWYYLVGLIVILGLLSGTYPALLLSNFNIIQSIRGGIKQTSFATYFRKGLVMFQFAISTLLIIGTTVIYKQLDYVLNKDLGINKDNLVMVDMEVDLSRKLETYKTELSRIPEVKSVTVASGNPIAGVRSTSSASWEGKDPNAGYEVNVIISDEDFFETMEMEIVAGRGFSEQLTDSTNFIINEVAAELMGFSDPLNKDLSFWGINGQIIGVVKNFHMANMYEPIAPLIVTCIDPAGMSDVALIRLEGNTNSALEAIEDITMQLNPNFEFDYEFIDQAYARGYENEQTVKVLASIFAVISIFISCLGLLGLASYSAEQRSKEIGVRKVHGASVPQILVMLTKDYSRLMIVAFIAAIPFGYYITQGWLDNFEFRTILDPSIFIAAGIITFLIAIITVATKSYQAATANPVLSLKEE